MVLDIYYSLCVKYKDMEDGLITTKEVGNYRIKIYYDTDSACPCESWDYEKRMSYDKGKLNN